MCLFVFYLGSNLSRLANKEILADISQLDPQYHKMFHMLYNNSTGALTLDSVLGAHCLLMSANFISKLTLASVANFWRGEEERQGILYIEISPQADIGNRDSWQILIFEVTFSSY